jgi:hypothetical protein
MKWQFTAPSVTRCVLCARPSRDGELRRAAQPGPGRGEIVESDADPTQDQIRSDQIRWLTCYKHMVAFIRVREAAGGRNSCQRLSPAIVIGYPWKKGFSMPKIRHGRPTREPSSTPQHLKLPEATPSRAASLRHSAPGAIVQRALAAPHSLRPAELLAMQRTLGNRAVGAMLGRQPIQAKLIVNAPGDEYEREADRVAEQVMRAPDMPREDLAEDEKREVLTRPTTPRCGAGAFAPGAGFEQLLDASRGRGQSLPSALQTDFEAKFGADFSGVTIHTDAQADALSRSMQAEAFTRGRDIYVASGQFVPNSRKGKRLLAHELTHVVQQDRHKSFKDHRDQHRPVISQLDYEITVQRKFAFEGTDLPHQHSSIYREIRRALDNYHAAKDPTIELDILQTIEVLLTEWLVEHGSSVEIAELRRQLTQEFYHLREEDSLQYMHRLQDTINVGVMNVKAAENPFRYITTQGLDAANFYSDEYNVAKVSANQDKINPAELAAIRIYTAGDYKYINPVLLNDATLLKDNLKRVGAKGAGGVETTWAFENVENMLDNLAAQRALKKEALQHHRRATAGLAKLPDVRHTTYRGVALSLDEIRKYTKGEKKTWMNFTSTGRNREPAEVWAKSLARQTGTVPVLMITDVVGKEINTLSVYKENEVLVLPGAEFVVTKDPVEKNGIYEVSLMQTDLAEYETMNEYQIMKNYYEKQTILEADAPTVESTRSMTDAQRANALLADRLIEQYLRLMDQRLDPASSPQVDANLIRIGKRLESLFPKKP